MAINQVCHKYQWAYIYMLFISVVCSTNHVTVLASQQSLTQTKLGFFNIKYRLNPNYEILPECGTTYKIFQKIPKYKSRSRDFFDDVIMSQHGH